MSARIPISICILTRNEEANIAACLKQFDFAGDVVVLDSNSTDQTRQIAERFDNVRVFVREFDSEHRQRNFSLKEIPYRHPWLYICDADERIDDVLKRELSEVAARGEEDPHNGYRVRYKNMFMGRWIRYASAYPVWLVRLVRPKFAVYEQRETNVHAVVDGSVGELQGHFLHYSFSTGLFHWFSKHNFYSGREAVEGCRVLREQRVRANDLFTADPMQRRRALKNLSFHLSPRGMWRFLYSVVWCGGWRDGMPGLLYCLMISMYEQWIEMKMGEAGSRPAPAAQT